MANYAVSFMKVSLKQFLEDAKKAGFVAEDADEESVKEIWENIKLPVRATAGSAGYDFFLPFNVSFSSRKSVLVPTGIRAIIEPDWFLAIFPRSGLGFKHGMSLANTCGIIDSDYMYADNEGHIMLKLNVKSNVCLSAGDKIVQGILLPFGISYQDNVTTNRKGGFGSTGR